MAIEPTPTPIEIACQEKYGVDFERQVQGILPYFWSFTIGNQQEKTVFLNWVWTLFSQFKPLNVSMVDFCSFITTRLNYTGQRMALTELLNDNYDNSLRRCWIECLDNNFVEGLDIYLDSEVDPTPIVIFEDGEVNDIPITVWLDSEIQDPESLYGQSFIVHIPITVPTSDTLIRALLDIYVIQPQEYLIIRF